MPDTKGDALRKNKFIRGTAELFVKHNTWTGPSGSYCECKGCEDIRRLFDPEAALSQAEASTDDLDAVYVSGFQDGFNRATTDGEKGGVRQDAEAGRDGPTNGGGQVSRPIGVSSGTPLSAPATEPCGSMHGKSVCVKPKGHGCHNSADGFTWTSHQKRLSAPATDGAEPAPVPCPNCGQYSDSPDCENHIFLPSPANTALSGGGHPEEHQLREALRGNVERALFLLLRGNETDKGNAKDRLREAVRQLDLLGFVAVSPWYRESDLSARPADEADDE